MHGIVEHGKKSKFYSKCKGKNFNQWNMGTSYHLITQANAWKTEYEQSGHRLNSKTIAAIKEGLRKIC